MLDRPTLLSRTAASQQRLASPRDETPRLPAMLLQQLDVAHRHAAVHRLAHVVDRQQRDLDGGQGFHLFHVNQRLTRPDVGRLSQQSLRKLDSCPTQLDTAWTENSAPSPRRIQQLRRWRRKRKRHKLTFVASGAVGLIQLRR
jgi:hypothetical protein